MKSVLHFLQRYNKIILFMLVLLAGYQVVIAGHSCSALAAWAYTLGFGVLVIAGLVMILLGNEVLEKPLVVIVSTIIPLSISLGLVIDYWPAWRWIYLGFVVLGFLILALTRTRFRTRLTALLLAGMHAVAGMIILLTPIAAFMAGTVAQAAFVWVSVGGALIGVGGLLLAFLRSGKVLLQQAEIFTLLPGILLLMTAAFSLGFAAV